MAEQKEKATIEPGDADISYLVVLSALTKELLAAKAVDGAALAARIEQFTPKEHTAGVAAVLDFFKSLARKASEGDGDAS